MFAQDGGKNRRKEGGPSSLPGNQGSFPQSSHRNRGARSHSRETQWAGVREGAVGIGRKRMKVSGEVGWSERSEEMVWDWETG